MEEIIFKKYKNRKVHTVNSERINGKVYDNHFCDTTLTDIISKKEEKIIEFKNIPCEMNGYTLCINSNIENKNVISYTYAWNSILHTDMDETFKIFNEFDINSYIIKYKTNIKSKMKKSLSTNEASTFNNNVAVNETETPVFPISYDDFIADKSVIEYKGLDIKLLEYSIDEENLITGKLSLTVNYFECKNCGEKLSKNFAREDAKPLLGVYLYDNENSIKISCIYKQVVTSKKLSWIRYYKNMYIYKKDTGKMYKVDDFNFAGSKYLKEKFKRKIRNYSITSCYSFFNQLYEENSEIGEAKKKFEELVLNHIELRFGKEYEYTKKDCEFLLGSKDKYHLIQILNIKNQYNIKNTILADLILFAKTNDSKFHNIIKGKTEKEIMDTLKLNNKRLTLVRNNNAYSILLSFFRYLNDINSINRLINMKKRHTNTIIDLVPKYKDFYNNYMKYNSEKKLLNQIEKLDNYYLIDTARLYEMIKSKIKDYEVDFTKNIKDLHDIFDNDYRKIKEPNEKIPQNKSIAKVFKNISINDITYRLAKETDELVKVGAIMDICVGGYRNQALNKECIIVVGYNKEEKPVTCIEIRKQQSFKVHQVKKRKNYLPKISESKALIELFESNKIEITTRDLDLNDSYRRLNEEDSELLGLRKSFTYAHNVPEELRQELVV